MTIKYDQGEWYGWQIWNDTGAIDRKSKAHFFPHNSEKAVCGKTVPRNADTMNPDPSDFDKCKRCLEKIK